MRKKVVVQARKSSTAELDVMDEFLQALRTGKKPRVAKFLRQHPEYAHALRPTLEGALVLDAALRRFRKECPDVDIEALFDVPGR